MSATRVDFYQLSRDPVEKVVAALAGKVLASGARAVVVADDPDLRKRLSTALWDEPNSFLAHGEAGGPDDARQPVLIAADCAAPNGATIALIADGKWREEATGFERVLLLFDEAATETARMAAAVLRIEAARQCGWLGRALDRELLTEAIRQTDLLLVHYADPQLLADAASAASTGRPQG